MGSCARFVKRSTLHHRRPSTVVARAGANAWAARRNVPRSLPGSADVGGTRRGPPRRADDRARLASAKSAKLHGEAATLGPLNAPRQRDLALAFDELGIQSDLAALDGCLKGGDLCARDRQPNDRTTPKARGAHEGHLLGYLNLRLALSSQMTSSASNMR